MQPFIVNFHIFISKLKMQIIIVIVKKKICRKETKISLPRTGSNLSSLQRQQKVGRKIAKANPLVLLKEDTYL